MNISEKVKALRKSKGLTQEQLADKAGLGHNSISIIETNRQEISVKTLAAIAKALEVNPQELVSDDELVFFVKLDELAYMPERAHDTDAGYDLRAPSYNMIPGNGSTVIDTGVHIAIPKGYAGILVSKSGLNINKGILSEGLIDSGYTGSIRVKLYNTTGTSYWIRPGDKVSQIVFLPIAEPELLQIDALPETERGNGGFGSTGR